MKYTLLIDGNFFLMKTFFVGQKIKKNVSLNFKDNPEEDKNLLLWKLATDFSTEIRRFENIVNRIVYCVDSSSWRKKLESSYKGNRKKTDDVNWTKLFETHDDFIQGLEKMGIIISRVSGTEADDLIFAWSTLLNQNGDNSLIISGDNDLLQLINHDKSSNTNTLYYNKFDKKLHGFIGFNTWIKDIKEDKSVKDIFNIDINSLYNVKEALQDIIKMNSIKLTEININDFIFKKILSGDNGDNVSPLYFKQKMSKTGQIRNFKITDNQIEKVINKFKDKKLHVTYSHFFNDEIIKFICEIVKEIVKIDDKSIDELMTKWKLNRDLMYLHINCIPKNLLDNMFDHIEKNNKNITNNNLNLINNKENILKNTSYIKQEYSKFDDSKSLFKDIINKDNKKSVKIINNKPIDSFNEDEWNDLLK